MTTHAIIENGTVSNLIEWDGDTDNWQPCDGATTREVRDGETVAIGDVFDAEVDAFVAPPESPEPPVSASQVLVRRGALLAGATLRIAPLQYAVDLKDATDDEKAALKYWKQYAVALNRIETQEGFPADVEWPKAPE